MTEPAEVLAEIAADGGGARDRLRLAYDNEPMIEALHIAEDEHCKVVLCGVLGWRRADDALDELVACLDHPADRVRAAAAEALGKIGDARAGDALLARFTLPDERVSVRSTVALALGAVGHGPAVPHLIRWLGSPSAVLRGGAAWSLERLQAEEALPALTEAYRTERDPYAKERMREARHTIESRIEPRS